MVVGSRSFQTVGRDVQVLLVVYYLGEIQLGRRDYGHQNMVTEPVEFEVVPSQTNCSTEVVVHEQVCD